MMKKICSIVSETLIPLDMPDKGQEKKQKIVAMRNASFKSSVLPMDSKPHIREDDRRKAMTNPVCKEQNKNASFHYGSIGYPMRHQLLMSTATL